MSRPRDLAEVRRDIARASRVLEATHGWTDADTIADRARVLRGLDDLRSAESRLVELGGGPAIVWVAPGDGRGEPPPLKTLPPFRLKTPEVSP